jgi:hypothetical protein
MSKLTFDDAMEMIGDERQVSRGDVLASALQRTVWIAEWHIPGCMSESRSYCTSKKDAIDCALSMANDEENGNRGMVTSLRKYGRFDSKTEMYGTVINTVSKHKLIDLL